MKATPRCHACSRVLTDAVSITIGFGPHCRTLFGITPGTDPRRLRAARLVAAGLRDGTMSRERAARLLAWVGDRDFAAVIAAGWWTPEVARRRRQVVARRGGRRARRAAERAQEEARLRGADWSRVPRERAAGLLDVLPLAFCERGCKMGGPWACLDARVPCGRSRTPTAASRAQADPVETRERSSTRPCGCADTWVERRTDKGWKPFSSSRVWCRSCLGVSQ